MATTSPAKWKVIVARSRRLLSKSNKSSASSSSLNPLALVSIPPNFPTSPERCDLKFLPLLGGRPATAQRFPIKAVYSVQVGPLTIRPFIPVTPNVPAPRLWCHVQASRRRSYATLTEETEDEGGGTDQWTRGWIPQNRHWREGGRPGWYQTFIRINQL